MVTAMTPGNPSYGADIPYLRDFKPMLAPAWLDQVALVGGIDPPDRRDSFAWCDLGCGQGVTAAVLAATHPGGTFQGIDAMEVHVDHGRRLAAAATIANVRFHAADFAAALELDLPQFDYIAAHGVYSWVDRDSRRFLRQFIDRRLKPGGLFLFTVEKALGESYELGPKRRYRHSELYLRQEAERANLEVMGILDCSPRDEAKVPVAGLAAALQRLDG